MSTRQYVQLKVGKVSHGNVTLLNREQENDELLSLFPGMSVEEINDCIDSWEIKALTDEAVEERESVYNSHGVMAMLADAY